MGRIACLVVGVLLLAAVRISVSKGSVRATRGGTPVYEIKRSSNPIGFWSAILAFGGFALLCLWAAVA